MADEIQQNLQPATQVQRVQTAAALIIGNELLGGKIADRNLQTLAKTMAGLGIRLCRAVTVLDEPATIVAEIRALSAEYDVVFTSGGVGPTHDDVTIDAVAAAFEVPVVPAPAIEDMLRAYHGDAITAGHLHMARIPSGARLVVSAAMPWPTVVMKNVWVLPGVPQIFAMKMQLVRDHLVGVAEFFSRMFYVDMDEGNLKPLLDATVARFQAVQIGSYPQWPEHPAKEGAPAHDFKRQPRTMVTFDGTDEELVNAAAVDLEAALAQML